MRASELIIQIQKLIDEKGDLEVSLESDEDEGFWPVTHTRIAHLLHLKRCVCRDVIGICGSEEVYSINSERIKMGIVPTIGGEDL
jgi:hypothetical protein